VSVYDAASSSFQPATFNVRLNGVWEPLSTATTFVSRFETGDFTNWSWPGSGTNPWTFDETAPVLEGSGSAKGDGNVNNFEQLFKDAGLSGEAYPAAGDTFEVDLYFPDSSSYRASIYFGVQTDVGANYEVEVDNRSPEIRLIRNDADGTTDVLFSDTTGWDPTQVTDGTWVTLRVAWATDGVMIVSILAQNDTTLYGPTDNSGEPDTTYTSGSVGLKIADPEVLAFDNWILV
jgi:hypothetical protein